jgi:hypothetical protein
MPRFRMSSLLPISFRMSEICLNLGIFQPALRQLLLRRVPIKFIMIKWSKAFTNWLDTNEIDQDVFLDGFRF